MRSLILKPLRLVCAVLLGLTALGAAGSAAAAPPQCQQYDPDTGTCLITIEDPGDGGGGDDGGGGGACHNKAGDVVDCYFGSAWWSYQYGCYMQPMVPQPDPSHPAWEGNTEGTIYECIKPGTGANVLIWLPPGAETVDPEMVARLAVARLTLHSVDIGIVPEPGAGVIGLVGLPTWMWVDQPGPQTWGPQTASATLGPVTVTVTAQVDRVVWDMGDGAVVTCRGPGTPYADSYGESPSPDCGHTYTTSSAGLPGDAFTVEATSYWTIDWAGGGGSGTIDMSFTSDVQVQVGEMQVLVTG